MIPHQKIKKKLVMEKTKNIFIFYYFIILESCITNVYVIYVYVQLILFMIAQLIK